LKCPKCGFEVGEDAKFCPKCGTALGVDVQPPIGRIREKGPKGPDILGAISAGVVLIIIALTYIVYIEKIDPTIIIEYFEGMAEQGTLRKPPLILFDPAIFFLYAVGVWGIVLSALRIILQRSARKALGDLIGGFFSFFLAFLLTNYAADLFTGRTTLAYFIIAIGLLVIVNTIIHFVFPERWQT